MSILIKGMEMPKNCYECLVRNQGFSGDGMKCGKTGSVLSWYDGNRKRMEDCPLVPVPPHGDLIDRDALKVKQQEDADLFINAYTLMEKSRRDEVLNAVVNIVNALTIIPAEEGE